MRILYAMQRESDGVFSCVSPFLADSPTVVIAGWIVVAVCVAAQGMAEQGLEQGRITVDFVVRWRLFPIALWGAAIPLVLATVRRWPLSGPRWPIGLAVHGVLFSAWMVISNVILRVPDAGELSSIAGDAVLAAVDYSAPGALAWTVLILVARVRDRAAEAGRQPVEGSVPASAGDVPRDRDVTDTPDATPDARPLPLRVGYRIHLIEPAAIRWIEADGDYVRVHTEARTLRVRTTMRAIQTRLPAAKFVRIHRSTLVNLAFVRELQPYFHGDYMAILRDGTELRVPRSRKDAIRRFTSSRGN